MSGRILIVVTHLLGAGHLTRSAALARALACAGHTVTLASGGMPVASIAMPGVHRVQLPPVRAVGTDFRTLRDEAGDPIDEGRLAARKDALLTLVQDTRPDLLVTELYPFGRRVLAAEFEAVVRAARGMRPRPMTVCSIRDILAAPTKPERIALTHRILRENYDAVLVHGDPDFLPLERSWPLDDAARALVHYTGYVDEGDGAPDATVASERDGIVVSGGSSAAGLPLQRAALGAAALLPSLEWRVLIGHAVPEAAFAALRAAAPANVRVERVRPDFRALLRGAALSVSQAGYNTTVDLLVTHCPSLLVPFEAGGETEQRLRAEHLARAGLAGIVLEEQLGPESLAQAVAAALARGSGPARAIALDGAARTVDLVEALLARRDAA